MPRLPTPRTARPGALAALVAAALLPLSACGQTPDGAGSEPTPSAARAAVAADSARILDALAWLASDERGGRGAGTPGGAAAREYLVARFAEAGVRAFRADGGKGAGGEGDAAAGRAALVRPLAPDEAGVANVVGWLPGTDPEAPWLVVTAHYDHLGTRDGVVYNGADDNASGTVALLFLARHLAESPLRHPVILAALDAEEDGLRGARAFVEGPPVPLDRIALNLNLDMLARTGGTLWAAGAFHTPALGPVLDDVARRAPLTLRQGHDRPGVPGEDDWTDASDHAPFHAAGIPFVYLGVEDHPDYHRPTDDVERIDPSEYLDAVATTLLVLQALDEALPLDGGSAPDPAAPDPAPRDPESP